MADHPVTGNAAKHLSRRDVLRAIGAGGAGAFLAARGWHPSGASAQSADPETYDFAISDTGADLPTDDVLLRWMDSGDQKAVFFEAFFPVYHELHSNIEIQYDGTNWNQIQQVLTLGFRNESAPDVFQLPGAIPAAQAVTNGWVGPLDDIVPNWPEVKARFPVGTFAPGVTDFDGKTYGYPFTSNNRINNLLLFNVDYLNEAGYDPGANILSWDEFRAAAKKCTEQGDGKYYGMVTGVTQNGSLPGTIRQLAEMAGAPGGNSPIGDFNFKTGEFNYATEQYVGAIDLLLAIKADGSFFPGTTSLDNPGARATMPQEVSAMILQGPWNIPIWTKANPDFHLGLNIPPQMNVDQISPLSHGPGGSNTWWIAGSSKLGQVVGDIFAYLGTVEGQTAWASFVGSGDPAAFPEAIEQAELEPLSQKALDLGLEWTRLRPDPAVRNIDVVKVYQELKPLTPDFNDTLVGLFTGQLDNSQEALQDLKDRSEAELDRAIAAAQEKGAQVTRDDFVFPDWDPMQNYTDLYT